MTTECCGREIDPTDRYCPRCGHECRVVAEGSIPRSAPPQELTEICTICQLRLPDRLLSFGMGPRGGTAAYCAACRQHAGPDADAKRQEVIAIRKAFLAAPALPGETP